MTKGTRFQVRDPVHGFIWLHDSEVKLLDTPAIQRLRQISQLAMANLVYPGAVHTRFDHSLGVTHVAGLMADELLNKDDVPLVRFAALLHDIGHGPFSHVSEDCLERYADRSKLKSGQEKDKIHELISAQIITTDQNILRILGTEMSENVARLLGPGYGQPAKRSIVSGPLDADKQDYLLRDSHFCGVPYGIFDIHQLHRSLTLGGREEEEELRIRRDGVHAVEQYVLAKYYLTTNVYRHKVRLITDQMIVRAIVLGIERDGIQELHELYAFDNSPDFVLRYMTWGDARFMQEFCCPRKGTKCSELLRRLRERRLLKRVFTARATDFADLEVRDMLLSLVDRPKKDLRARIEKGVAEQIQDKCHQCIDPDLVILNVFTIRNVREMSRNSEGEILVENEPQPKPFSQESTLFASIDQRYADQFVEVYAPVQWATVADKNAVRRDLNEPIMETITSDCRADLQGGVK